MPPDDRGDAPASNTIPSSGTAIDVYTPPTERPRTVYGPAVTVVSIAAVYGRCFGAAGGAPARIAASMFWYSLLAIVAILFLLSVSLPVPRRIWAFTIYSFKYFWLWIGDAIGVRKLILNLT